MRIAIKWWATKTFSVGHRTLSNRLYAVSLSVPRRFYIRLWCMDLWYANEMPKFKYKSPFFTNCTGCRRAVCIELLFSFISQNRQGICPTRRSVFGHPKKIWSVVCASAPHSQNPDWARPHAHMLKLNHQSPIRKPGPCWSWKGTSSRVGTDVGYEIMK